MPGLGRKKTARGMKTATAGIPGYEIHWTSKTGVKKSYSIIHPRDHTVRKIFYEKFAGKLFTEYKTFQANLEESNF